MLKINILNNGVEYLSWLSRCILKVTSEEKKHLVSNETCPNPKLYECEYSAHTNKQ